jgi:membrane protein
MAAPLEILQVTMVANWILALPVQNERTPDAKVTDQGHDWRAEVGASENSDRSVDLARSREPGRGREAITPEQIPPRGWRDILWRVFWSISADRILSTSGGVAFFALLAVFPGMAAIVSMYGLFADASTIGKHLSLLSGFLPGGVLDLMAEQIALISRQGNQTLGRAFVVGLLIALGSANSGMAALFDALNVVYDEREKRSLVKFYATTFLFTLAGIVFVILAITGVVVLPVMLKFVGLPTTTERLLAILRWPILFVTVVVSLACIYRYGPSRRDARWRWVTWGSILAAAALLWMGSSMLFSWYVATFDTYNKIYGSLGAGVGFMVWLWLSAVIVLLGGELNAQMEHQTARDTTKGGSKPLGSRGAMMADHVGEAQI